MSPKIEHLSERAPSVSAEQLLEGFRPSERFGEVSFDTYRPDPSQPSQAEAVEVLKRFAASIQAPSQKLSLIHISEPTRRLRGSRMPSSA